MAAASISADAGGVLTGVLLCDTLVRLSKKGFDNIRQRGNQFRVHNDAWFEVETADLIASFYNEFRVAYVGI